MSAAGHDAADGRPLPAAGGGPSSSPTSCPAGSRTSTSSAPGWSAAGYDVTLYVSAPEPGEARLAQHGHVGAVRGRLDPDGAGRVPALQRGADRARRVPAQPAARLPASARRHPDALFVLWTSIPILTWGPALRLLGGASLYLVTGLGPVFASIERRPTPAGRRRAGRAAAVPTDRCRILVHNRDDKAFLCRHVRAAAGPRRGHRRAAAWTRAEFPFSDLPASPRRRDPDAVGSDRPGAGPPAGRQGRARRSRGVGTAGRGRHGPRDVVHLEPRSDPPDRADRRGRRPHHPVAPERAVPRLPGRAARCATAVRRRLRPDLLPRGLPTALLEAASMGGRSSPATTSVAGLRPRRRSTGRGPTPLPRDAGRRPRAAADRAGPTPNACAAAPTSGSSSGYTKQAMLDLTVDAIEQLGFPVGRPVRCRPVGAHDRTAMIMAGAGAGAWPDRGSTGPSCSWRCRAHPPRVEPARRSSGRGRAGATSRWRRRRPRCGRSSPVRCGRIADRRRRRVELEELVEDRPLGNIGAVGVARRIGRPVLVVYADNLTGCRPAPDLDDHLSERGRPDPGRPSR